ncbi:aminotransferase class I/II-fold pyridoxal phosphate-dependent enzyme [Collinsella sp. AGMB00827]|uniref:Aminotransferase n=1 Tax=Collinsella ureilytica TaxID=2869515 RepID=A0ABS7MIS7_9ACTN|nr:aminotransferase class I/II-fold pyridoxal phosphate-dependent enzyme [Collinsella urealyticum]MBY4797152.1 aminotransferase class I/II-fold pyridoxal phosphate-dependent enzyme [Collinsella urealyticum]
MRRPTNSRLARLQPSGIRRIHALSQQHPGCIALALGEPEFDTPKEICEEVSHALDRGETHYPPNNGTAHLREDIARFMAASGVAFSPQEIIVTAGATEALSATFLALLDPGDEVIIPLPAFGLYESIVTACHAQPVFLDTCASGFQISEAALAQVVSSRTKAIVITSPNNPTGCALNAASLDAIRRVAAQTGIYVVCDDVYYRLVYTSCFERMAVRHASLAEQLIVVESFSKPWAMTGWRLGWVGAKEDVSVEIAKAHQYLVSSVPAFLMPAAQRALAVDPAPILDVYRRRRELVLCELKAMGLPVVVPDGAFYAFPSIQKTGLVSEDFCERAIREAGVAVVPGTCFGAEGFIRLSYCVSDDDLREGLVRLKRFVQQLI